MESASWTNGVLILASTARNLMAAALGWLTNTSQPAASNPIMTQVCRFKFRYWFLATRDA
jgi:hypothetical protein